MFIQSCQDENIKIFVSEEAGSVLGYCITRKLEFKDHHMFFDMMILEIVNLCVDEKARGKSIGRQLFERAKEYGNEIRATRLELTVWVFNKNAKQFYEHLGMSERTHRLGMNI